MRIPPDGEFPEVTLDSGQRDSLYGILRRVERQNRRDARRAFFHRIGVKWFGLEPALDEVLDRPIPDDLDNSILRRLENLYSESQEDPKSRGQVTTLSNEIMRWQEEDV